MSSVVKKARSLERKRERERERQMIGRDRDKDRQRQSQRERLRPKSEKPALRSQQASGFLRIGTEYRK